MSEFLASHHIQGLVIGLCSFLIIGVCHPIVIKGEYHLGQRLRWILLAAGLVLCAASIAVGDVLWSTLLGVGAFSCFWGIKETSDQQERVRKGWFPRNPRRRYPWDVDENDASVDKKRPQD